MTCYNALGMFLAFVAGIAFNAFGGMLFDALVHRWQQRSFMKHDDYYDIRGGR